MICVIMFVKGKCWPYFNECYVLLIQFVFLKHIPLLVNDFLKNLNGGLLMCPGTIRTNHADELLKHVAATIQN